MAAYFDGNSGNGQGGGRAPRRPRRKKLTPNKLTYPPHVYHEYIDHMLDELRAHGMYTPQAATLHEIGTGDTSAHNTIRSMTDYVREGVQDPFVRSAAEFIVDPVPQKQYLNEIKQCFYFVRDACTYRKDTYNLEMNKSCRRLLEGRQFDCDDAATLLLALCYSMGHGPGEFVLVAADDGRPEDYSHVYCQIHHNGRWYPMDATMKKPFGWEVPGGDLRRTRLPVPMDAAEAQDVAGDW
jgi:hypothetical protein